MPPCFFGSLDPRHALVDVIAFLSLCLRSAQGVDGGIQREAEGDHLPQHPVAAPEHPGVPQPLPEGLKPNPTLRIRPDLQVNERRQQIRLLPQSLQRLLWLPFA